MARSLTFIADGDVDTRITITENADGTLSFDIAALGDLVGDLRAIFLDLNGLDVGAGDIFVTGAADVTDYVSGEGDIDRVSKDANIKGSVSNELGDFDVGIEFGISGMAGDDIQATTFTLGSLSGPLTLNMLGFADFGFRYTSVGTGEDRNASAKIGDTTGGVAANDALEVAENATGSVNLLANDSATGTVIPQTMTLATAAGLFGTLTIAADGTATVIADGPAADALNNGESAAFVVNYAVETGDELATASLTISITGETDGIPLFTEGDDVVVFGQLAPGIYDPASFYDAGAGNDIVFLPDTQAEADAIGYDLSQTFLAGDGVDRIEIGDIGATVDAGAGNDSVIGGDGDDLVYGGPGTEFIRTAGGDDTVYGGEGTLVVFGGTGNDTYVVGDGGAGIANYQSYGSGIVLDAQSGTVTKDTGTDTLEGRFLTYAATQFDDVVTGTSSVSARYLLGGGNDSFTGGDLQDVVLLLSGDDTVDGAGGFDRVQFEAYASGITVDFASGIVTSGLGDTVTLIDVEQIFGTTHDDVFLGSDGAENVYGFQGDDLMIGGDGNDVLYGDYFNKIGAEAGNDTLDGGPGEDNLSGEAGDDLLTGGTGVDIFNFTNRYAGDDMGNDIITDFEAGVDIIRYYDLRAEGLTTTQQGADVLITFNDSGTTLVQNAMLTDVEDALFVF